MSNDGGLSPAVMQQLADMINTQIDKKLEKRDEQMMEMQKSMTNLMGENGVIIYQTKKIQKQVKILDL